jgi:hypothetical protein
MLFRVFTANLSAEQVAQVGQSLGMSGTVFAGFGFGDWGIEPTVVAEIGGVGREEIRRFVAEIFKTAPAEQAVYVHDGEVGEVWFRAGRV